MKILGIDYGRAKVGLAIAVSSLAEPFSVIRYQDTQKLLEKIKEVVDKEKIEKIVVGLSENEMAEESNNFSEILKKDFGLEVETFDETLSSREAQKMAIASGVPQKKRHEMEDAYAATIMLQGYLDSLA